MARLRRTSTVLETLRQRLAGLKTITPAPDLGPGLTIAAIEAVADDLESEVDGYNQDVAALDVRQNRLESKEDNVNDINKRILAATKGHFGPDSSEYEAVGGTRESERKKAPRKPKGGGGPPPAP